MIPHYKSLSGCVIFQQDGAKYHIAKVVSSVLEELRVEVMKWPAQSLDLNSIDNVWHLLNLKIHKRMSSTHSYQQPEHVFPQE